jgi:hypothetical protein
MKRTAQRVAVVAGLLLGGSLLHAAPAGAAGQVCVEVRVWINNSAIPFAQCVTVTANGHTYCEVPQDLKILGNGVGVTPCNPLL